MNQSRRNFLGAAMTLAVLPGCKRKPTRQLIALNSKLVLLGDSITHMGMVEGAENPSGPAGCISFTNQGFGNLANILSGSRLFVPPDGNQGKNADTVAGVLARLDKTIALQPKVVLLLIGINSIFHQVAEDSIMEDYRSICDRLLAAGCIVVAVTILPCFKGRYGEFTAPQEELRQRLNAFILRLPGILPVDMGTDISQADLIDGLHPNARGAYKMACKVQPVFNQLLPPGKIMLFKRKSQNYVLNPSLQGTRGQLLQATGVVADHWQLDAGTLDSQVVTAAKSPADGKQLLQLNGKNAGGCKSIALSSEKMVNLSAGVIIEGLLDIELLTPCKNILTIDLRVEGLDANRQRVVAGQAFYEASHLPLQLPVGRYNFRTAPQALPQMITSVKSTILVTFTDEAIESPVEAAIKIHSCMVAVV